MLSFIFESLSLVLPIFVAGIVFIYVIKKDYLQLLNTPIDSGITFRKKRLLGENKTWRGIAIYTSISLLVCWILQLLSIVIPGGIHPIFATSPLYVGLIFSLSYIAGELLNSFVKRQLDIAPGVHGGSFTQKTIDNIDGMLVVAMTLFVLLQVSPWNILAALAAGIILHKSTDRVMKHLGLK